MENVNSKPFCPSENECNFCNSFKLLGKKIIGVALGALASVAVIFLSLISGNGVMKSLRIGLRSAVAVYTFLNISRSHPPQ